MYLVHEQVHMNNITAIETAIHVSDTCTATATTRHSALRQQPP
jgi:hypothetical protein